MSIFAEGLLTFSALPEPIRLVLYTAGSKAEELRARQIGGSQVLLALLEALDSSQAAALESGLTNGTPRDVIDIVRLHRPPRPLLMPQVFTGALNDYSPQMRSALGWLDQVTETGFETEGEKALSFPPTPPEALTVAHLWIAALAYPEEEDREDLAPLLDFEKAIQAFYALLSAEGTLPPLYDEAADDALRLDLFNETAIELWERAARAAGEGGYEKIIPAHLLIALIATPDSVGEQAVRRLARLGVGPADVVKEIERNIDLGYRGKPKQLGLFRRDFSLPVQRGLETAFRRAIRQGGENALIDERHLMFGMLSEERQGRLADILRGPQLGIDPEKMIANLDQQIARTRAAEAQVFVPFTLPRQLGRSEDLTYLAQMGRLPVCVLPETPPGRTSAETESPLERIKRGLYRRQNNHILITGASGVGKTTLLYGLARQIAAGEIPFLRRKKLIWVDCGEITPEESRDKLEQIITAVKGRGNVILCLDKFEAVVRFIGQREANNLLTLRNALQNGYLHLIGIIEDRYYNELLSADYQFLKFFTRVQVEEPDYETARVILDQLRPELEHDFKARIDQTAIGKAVILARDYVMSERFPLKALDILKDACERARYEQEMRAAETSGDRPALVLAEHVIAAVSQKTGIPASVLQGAGDGSDFEAMLKQVVVGQDHVVEAIARELKLIMSGMKDPNKPAGVYFFAGMTGTGKSELAKCIAQIYSVSKKPTVYTMGNFSEPHTVSGIVGVPPGYVGYEMGGRLINDLNSDPYSVVLLDEAEKAHPDIWKPFLNLFDEAWITDQRNVRAYGNRAIFILTSNAGADEIYQKFQPKPAASGKASTGRWVQSVDDETPADDESSRQIETITEEVTELLRKTYFRRDPTQRCFSDEFLARMTKIFIFRPLDAGALGKIVTLKLDALIKTWDEKRGKRLVIDPAVARFVTDDCAAAYAESRGAKGGRIVQKRIADLVESALQTAVESDIDAYKRARVLRVSLGRDGLPAARLLETED